MQFNNFFIQECIDKHYAVMNCDEKKRPALDNWSKRPAKDFYESVKPTGFYTMRMGLQENGDYIINLDFDLKEKNKKTGKYDKENHFTRKLLDEWMEINEDEHGLFNSSTQGNMGNLVDITQCQKLIDLIADIGKSKFEMNSQKKKDATLEILCSSLCILPPTKTICKVAKKAITQRTFMSEMDPILHLEENTHQYKFIYNYCLQYKKKHCKSTKMRDLRSKQKKELYTEIHDGKYKVNSLEHGLELLCLLKESRYCYDNWWKIGVSCINSFEREFAEQLFVKWSERDPSGNFDGEIPFNAWADNTYDGLNWNWIMKLVEYDSPSKMIPCVQSYKRKQVQEKYEEYKKYFEDTYHYCKDPQVFFYKSKRGKYIQKTMKEVRELEKHNIEFFDEWCADQDRKMYEMSDSIPVKTLKDPLVFNTFRGYDFWDWESDWYSTAKNSTTDLKKETMKWWNKYIYHLCGKNNDMVSYVKCILGNVLYNPQNPTKCIVIFQGVEGTGKSMVINILRRLIGGLNVAESANPREEIFGKFNEPLLYSTVVSLDENNPKSMEAILDQLKNKITNENFLVNCKNEKMFVKTNTHQWLGFMNKFCTFAITTTNRRFCLQKTSMDLAIKNEDNSKFWSQGYGTILETKECLQYIAMDLKDEFEMRDGYNMDFALARPQTSYQVNITQQAIPPLFTYLQHIISSPLKSYKQYEQDKEEGETKSSYHKWYNTHFIHEKEKSFIPLSNSVIRKLKKMQKIDNDATDFWIVNMKHFRKSLNEYVSKNLDKKTFEMNSDDIYGELYNFFECDKKLFDKINIQGQFNYVLNPKLTKEQLLKFKYYVVENDDCELSDKKGITGFDIYALSDDEEEEEENIVENIDGDEDEYDPLDH